MTASTSPVCQYCDSARLVARGPVQSVNTEQPWRRYRCADCMGEMDYPAVTPPTEPHCWINRWHGGRQVSQCDTCQLILPARNERNLPEYGCPGSLLVQMYPEARDARWPNTPEAQS